jgi:shikimate kinase
LVELLGDPKDMVVALGGGTPCYGDNMRLILEHTNDVFYLQLSIPELINRLHKEKAERPLIAHIKNDDLPEFIGKHIFERTPYYKQATHTISCTHATEKEIVKIIEGLLVQKN